MWNWFAMNLFTQSFSTPPTVDSELKDSRKWLVWSIVMLVMSLALFVSCFVIPIQSDMVILVACLFFIVFGVRTIGFTYEVIKWSKIAAKGYRYTPLHKLPSDINY